MSEEIKFRTRTLEGNWIDFRLHETHLSGDDGVFYVGDTPCEVGTERRSTSLKDKNGVEIYEGDIVSIGAKQHTFIDYEGASFVQRWITPNGNKSTAWSEISYHRSGSDRVAFVEVIGNIYENPELLEAKS